MDSIILCLEYKVLQHESYKLLGQSERLKMQKLKTQYSQKSAPYGDQYMLTIHYPHILQKEKIKTMCMHTINLSDHIRKMLYLLPRQ